MNLCLVVRPMTVVGTLGLVYFGWRVRHNYIVIRDKKQPEYTEMADKIANRVERLLYGEVSPKKKPSQFSRIAYSQR